MLRKEIQGALKRSLFFLAVVVGISMVIKIVLPEVGSYLEVSYLMYQFLMVWFGAFMGLSLFLSDKRQGAGDYVSSLPYSRLRLLGIKVLPRLTARAVMGNSRGSTKKGPGYLKMAKRGKILCWPMVTLPISLTSKKKSRLKRDRHECL